MEVVNVVVGIFPGKTDSYAVEVGTTIAAVLTMAGLAQGPEQDIKVDGEVASANDTVKATTRMILLAKRIKGAVA